MAYEAGVLTLYVYTVKHWENDTAKDKQGLQISTQMDIPSAFLWFLLSFTCNKNLRGCGTYINLKPECPLSEDAYTHIHMDMLLSEPFFASDWVTATVSVQQRATAGWKMTKEQSSVASEAVTSAGGLILWNLWDYTEFKLKREQPQKEPCHHNFNGSVRMTWLDLRRREGMDW